MDMVRQQIGDLKLPVKNQDIIKTESSIRKLQDKLSNVSLKQVNTRRELTIKINQLKIKLNELMSSPDAYTGEFKKGKEEKQRKTFNKSTSKPFGKEF
jgi:hypothetical protein